MLLPVTKRKCTGKNVTYNKESAQVKMLPVTKRKCTGKNVTYNKERVHR